MKLGQFINVARGFESDMTHGGAGKGEAGSSPGYEQGDRMRTFGACYDILAK